MRPGDVVTCSSCGAEGRLWSSSPANWREGEVLIVTWCNGPHPRHETFHEEPVTCSWCDEREKGWPSLMSRPSSSEAPWSAGGPRCTFEIPVIPSRAGEGPLNVGNPPPPQADGSDGNKAPLERPNDVALGAALPLASRDDLHALELPERFVELARAYRSETGRWPYGYPLSAIPAGDSIDRTDEPWREWCRKRAAAAAPKRQPAKPKGQMGLFG